MAKITIAEAYKQAIRGEMLKDDTVFCIGEDEDIPGGMGGSFTCLSATEMASSPSKGTRPVAASYITMPSE